jgi:protoheme ferro-lyase
MPSSSCEAKAQAPSPRSQSAVLLIASAIGCTTCRRDRCPLYELLVIDAHAARACGRSDSDARPPTSELDLPASLRSQVAGLRRQLGKAWHVLGAVHGDSPSIADALREVEILGVERLVVIPMHPQFGPSFAGAQLDELYACLRRLKLELHIEVRTSWHDDSAFIDATAARLFAFANAEGLTPRNAMLVFQARLPEQDTARYREQVAATAELVRQRLGWPQNLAATVFGDVSTAPNVLDDLAEQADALDPGASRRVLVCPITDLSRRPCEHSVCASAYRAAMPARVVELCPAANDHEDFIKALAQLARRPRHSAYDLAHRPEPLFPRIDVSEDVEREIGSLIMIGAEVEGALGQGQGPGLRYTSPADFRAIKRTHLETIDLLRHAAQCADIRECFIWNTCTRFELYAWLPSAQPAQRKTLERLAALAFPGANPRTLNVLAGPAARAHMLRTAAGLNSRLIGDAEVVDQLDACRRAGEHAGAAGPLTNDLVDDVIRAVRGLREATQWRAFDNRYCATVISRLADRLKAPMAGQILIIGGSTTSCSIMETLIRQFRVPRERISLIYRGRRKGSLVKRLHNAAGEGQVTIVESYTDPLVLRAIAKSDLVFLGIDQREAIATSNDLLGCRDLSARALTVLDFNTFGSIKPASTARGLDFLTAKEIDAGIGAFNDDATTRPDFASALAQAEVWVAQHAGVARGDELITASDFPLPTSACEAA